MLNSYRVLDFTDERGQLAGFILAALGAEVIAVEPTGGTPSRRVGPFAGDQNTPETSLFHAAYNRGKQSVVVDGASPHARDDLEALLRSADVVFTTTPGGLLDDVGIDPATATQINPALVFVTISAYGTTGPKANWPSSELTVNAASGQLVLTGDADRAPLRISAPPQSFLQAAGDAAGAALLALSERKQSGLGQHVDCSAQTSMLASTQQYGVASLIGAPALQRAGGGVVSSGLHVKLVWECKDGYVSLTLLFGASLGPFAQRLFAWMCEEGLCVPADRDKDWVNLGMHLWNGQETHEEWERLKGLVSEFLLTKTKAELLEASLSRKLLFAPLSTTEELAALPQLGARDYWDDVETGGDGPVRFPGRFCLFSASQPPTLARPPRLGEHTAAVLSQVHDRRPAATATGQPDLPLSGLPLSGLPLSGLKVLDFMWAVAGPSVTRVLADYGATVVKIESQRSIDGARTVGPFRNDDPGPDNTGLFHSMGANKHNLALDLTRPEARDVVLDLVRWADVVTESFSPKAMKAWGLDWPSLAAVNPRLVMLSSCLMGQTGPMALYAGFGTMAAAICGFHHLTGWPDRGPVGPFSAYTDYVAPRFALPALLAALDHRDRTGEGQHLDFSQLEASLHLLAPQLLDYSVNGRVAQRRGNDDERFAPHGVYRCAGDDRWVAIVCETDEQWRTLAGLVGEPDLAALGAEARLERRRELDKVIEQFTETLGEAEVEERLIAAGVPAHRVQNSPELANDPQLAHRGTFVELPHPTHSSAWVESSRFILSRTPAHLWRAGAPFGNDAYEVLHDLLGYDDDRIADLAAAELLE